MNSNEKDACSQYVIPQKYANDENQRRVIELETGRNLVLAPAGCGKTDILAERVARAIEMGVAKEDMAILTFTNRASREMKERIESRINEDVDDTLFALALHSARHPTRYPYPSRRRNPRHSQRITERQWSGFKIRLRCPAVRAPADTVSDEAPAPGHPAEKERKS